MFGYAYTHLPVCVFVDSTRSISYKYCGATELVHSEPTHYVATFYRLKIDSRVRDCSAHSAFIYRSMSFNNNRRHLRHFHFRLLRFNAPYVWNKAAYLSWVWRDVAYMLQICWFAIQCRIKVVIIFSNIVKSRFEVFTNCLHRRNIYFCLSPIPNTLDNSIFTYFVILYLCLSISKNKFKIFKLLFKSEW